MCCHVWLKGSKLVKGIFVSPLSAAMDCFSAAFSGTAFWNGLQSQTSQPKTPDPFEAPWESQAFLSRMGEAPLTKVPSIDPIEMSDIVVAALIREGKTKTKADIPQLPSGSQGLRKAMSKDFKVTKLDFDKQFKVIKIANPRSKPHPREGLDKTKGSEESEKSLSTFADAIVGDP